ncbi:TYRO protein tyrosine kinase-binding protein [Osmerus mordax]|uniref:TYRO protein tyrosine kinase-binding protein n=1 Tax=Osmerus mordax TaxID=8014 RepID=UPI00350FE26F
MAKDFCIVAPLNGMFGPTEEGQECGHCYQLDLGALVGIIICDIILTLFLAASVFSFTVCKRKRSRASPHEAMAKTSSSVRKTAEITESPYQELHGVQLNVYEDLQTFRK